MARLRSIKKHTSSLAWVLTALLALSPIGQHTVYAVLCVGSDGHIDSEVLGDSGCDSPANDSRTDAHNSVVSGNGTEGSHCRSCLDIPLPTGGDTDCGSFKTESGPSASTILAVVAVVPESRNITAVSPPVSGSMSHYPAPAQVLAELYGVVLLI